MWDAFCLYHFAMHSHVVDSTLNCDDICDCLEIKNAKRQDSKTLIFGLSGFFIFRIALSESVFYLK